jgi:rhodanese-related sulfurtransferase
MSRISVDKRVLFLCLLIVLVTSACGNAPQPATSSTTISEVQRNPNVDMKPVLREFLESLPADWNLVTAQEVAKATPFIMDVRQPDEYSRGFIAGAVNIPLRELAKNLQALPDMNQDIVVVCDTGHRSAIGMAVLQMLGYKKAKTLEGGMQAWQAAKQSVVTTPVTQKQTNPAPKVNAQIQAMLDYYLVHTLPIDWGIIDVSGLVADQKLLPSSAVEAMPETYDQGPSLLVDVDTLEEFQKSILATYHRAINLPLRQLPDTLDNMPLEATIDWA